jgi:hypothetical protein
VWNQSFKDHFIDTVLLNYPAPAIFLFEETTPDGKSTYHVVDGKQRLTTLFEFVRDEFAVPDESPLEALRGRYFKSFDDTLKRSFWAYQFLVEYIPTTDEVLISGIFDRINRNVAKLTPQELRHARLDGAFITVAEALAEWMTAVLPPNFPRLAPQSRKQMKDVELVALLLLLLENGPQGYSQADLDKAFTNRDESWEHEARVTPLFKTAIGYIKSMLDSPEGRDLGSTRLQNQADFYALLGAVAALFRADELRSPADAATSLQRFADAVSQDHARSQDEALAGYYEAARSASNDKGPREVRIAYLTQVLQGTAP